MYRTVDNPFQHSSAVIQLVLCILVGCMSLYLILEDARLLSTTTWSTSTQVADFNDDEMTHQDDLVILAALPIDAAQNNITAVTAWDVPYKKQFISPILTPPKVA